jgi:IclR family KDG regulon transcriptional repressor
MDKTFVKGLTLIEVLAGSSEPRGVTDLARELEMTKSNIHRLLNTLAAQGYVSKNPKTSAYDLTMKIWELGILVRSRLDLAQVSRDHMSHLAEVTGESVHLSLLDGFEVVYIGKIDSQHPIGAYTRIGGRAPALCVATGKAMLAFRLEDHNKIAPPMKQYTKASITSIAALRDEFKTIRAQGYAINRGEWRDGVCGVAAPIRDAADQIVGSIGISGPATRFRPKQIKVWSTTVLQAADAISQALGYARSTKQQPANLIRGARMPA